MTDDNTYPMPRPDDDPRFTLGLIFDVRQAIVDHGYPDIRHPLDLVNLQQALFRYLYAPAEAE